MANAFVVVILHPSNELVVRNHLADVLVDECVTDAKGSAAEGLADSSELTRASPLQPSRPNPSSPSARCAKERTRVSGSYINGS